jgi:hypothetical protein
MNATARRSAPSVLDILRSEVETLRAENRELRGALSVERRRRQTNLDLAGAHVRALVAFVEHTQRELKQDADEEKAQRT